MAHGGVEGTKSLVASLAYVSNPEPKNTEHVTERNLEVWTHGLPNYDAPLYDRMKKVLDAYPNPRRKYEAYGYLISYGTDEFDVDNPDDIEAAKEHVRQTCEKHFGDNVAYAVHVQGDGEGGKLHAHVTALNVDLDTGKTIYNKTGVYGWRKSMNEVTKEREKSNEKLPYPTKNAKIIKPDKSRRRKPKGEMNQWHDELMNKVDNVVRNTTAASFEEFVEELEDENISLITEKREVKGREMETAQYEYSPPGGVVINGKARKKRNVKSSKLGTDYMFDGLVERFELRQQELLTREVVRRDPTSQQRTYGVENESVKSSPLPTPTPAYNTDGNEGVLYNVDFNAQEPENEPVTAPIAKGELTQAEREGLAAKELYKKYFRETTQQPQQGQNGKDSAELDV